MALMPPEKAGIWSYPYPVMCDDASRVIDADYFDDMSDGEQTSFNMINAICGSPYLSGRIDFCDEYNRSLISEAVETFKSYRGMLKGAYPVFPLGQLGINQRGYLALGLISKDGDDMLLAVWKIDAPCTCAKLKLHSKIKEASLIYPKNDTRVSFGAQGDTLELSFPEDKKYMARMFRIKF
jgi:hypothetical protein